MPCCLFSEYPSGLCCANGGCSVCAQPLVPTPHHNLFNTHMNEPRFVSVKGKEASVSGADLGSFAANLLCGGLRVEEPGDTCPRTFWKR